MTPARYVLNLLKLLSVIVNVALFCDSKIQTLSRRAGVARQEGRRWGCVLCALINPIFRRLTGQRDHCEDSVKAGCILRRSEIL